jgi:hypothetical protein
MALLVLALLDGWGINSMEMNSYTQTNTMQSLEVLGFWSSGASSKQSYDEAIGFILKPSSQYTYKC